MNKEIRLTRDELVWERRICYYTEEMFNKWKKFEIQYYESRKKEPFLVEQNFDEVIDLLRNFTWEQAIKGINDNEMQESLFVRIVYKYKQDENKYSYTFFLFDSLISDIRDLNYSCDINDSWYADDYDEDFAIFENTEE